MTTIANIAQRVLAENGLILTNFTGLTLTILEYKIDDAIDYVNLQAGLTIANLSGSAESKSITGTDGQILVVKWLANMMLRAFKEKGTQATISGLSVVQVVNDSDTATTKFILGAIERLKEPPIMVSNEPVE